MKRIVKEVFGVTKDNKEVTAVTLTNKNGMMAVFLDFGAVIKNIFVPDKNGNLEDVVLGCDSVKGYEENTSSLGAFVGRCANRIAGGKFTINGKDYEIAKNEKGKNNLHGGEPFYNKLMYDYECFEDEDAASVEFSRMSPDGEQGFPGNLDITVTYTLTDDNELVIEYLAVSDMDTVVNFTNHSYFNLAGHKSGSVLGHQVMIDADKYTLTDDDLIPTGELKEVENTPYDFRELKPLSNDIEAAGGYDDNFALNHTGDDVEKAAEFYEPESGRLMEVYTNLPGIQLYTANGLNETENTKEGAAYKKYAAVCFETQFFPNACNTESFQSSIIKAGEEYDYQTVYKFSVR